VTEPARPERVLVVDDDPDIARIVRAYLEQAGYGVTTAADGRSALAALRQDRPDALVLDVMLPDGDGWEITRQLRADPALRRLPIILLTARVEDVDKIVGLELGADDYVTKPFNPRELVARVRALLRRAHDTAVEDPTAVLVSGGLRLDPGTRELRRDGQPVELTRTEFALLELFLRRPGLVYSREALIAACLGGDYQGLDRSLDGHIRNLRRKIDGEPPPAAGSRIRTVYGVGYRLATPAERDEGT
jgi:two-component system alkaline phosphatase synthesis response regulator PhoP